MNNDPKLQKIFEHYFHLIEVKDKVQDPFKVFVNNSINQINDYLTAYAKSHSERKQ